MWFAPIACVLFDVPIAARVSFLSHRGVALAVVGLAGSLAPLAPVPALLVALGWVALGGARFGVRGYVLLAFVFFVSGVRAEGATTEFERARVEARDAIGRPERCAASVRVVSSPTLRTAPRVDGGAPREWTDASADASQAADGAREEMEELERTLVWLAEAPRLSCESKEIPGPLLVRLSGGPEDLRRGDRAHVVAGLAPIQLFRNAALSDPTPGAARRGAVLSGAALSVELEERGRGLGGRIDAARSRVRARIEASYAPVTVSLGRALVLGENDLSTAEAAAFSRSGLMHLLAVSGTHLVIAVVTLVSALRALLVRCGPLARRFDVARLGGLLGAALALLYADFAGGSGSAWRAAYMLCAVFGGRALGRRVAGSTALGVSLGVGLVLDPLAGSDLSFLLSALATAGLLGIGQPLTRFFERTVAGSAPLRWLTGSLIATVSSTLPCAPALAFLDGEMTWVALLGNVVAGPLGELFALPTCLLHALAAPLPPLERGLAFVGSGALFGVRAVALWSAGVESARFVVPLPSGFSVACSILGCLGVLRGARSFGGRSALTTGFVFVWWGASRFGCAWWGASPLGPSTDLGPATNFESSTSGVFTVTALDVGQGDALALEFPNGELAFVDGGGVPASTLDPGERVLLPFLRARGRARVDLVVLSHAHPDHLLGLVSLARRVPITELWHPRGASPERGAYRELLELVRRLGGRVLGPPELCAPRSFGGVRVEVLAPCPGPEGLGANDESLVVSWQYGARRVLLSGDVERAGEERLVERAGARLRADLLKVPHHGSDTSSSAALLDAVAPRWAFVSSGVRNRFDHPRPSVLESYAARGIELLRTDRRGSLSFHTDGERVWLSSFGELGGSWR